MQHRKNYQISLFVIGCILINCLGKWIAAAGQLPVWMDSFGTVCSAYALGPFCGGVVGAATNVIYGFYYKTSYVYALTNIAVGILTGYYASKGYLRDLFKTMSLSFLITLLSVGVSVPLNYVFYSGRTGNIWGDGVIDLLGQMGFRSWMCGVIGEFYVDFLDKVVVTNHYDVRRAGTVRFERVPVDASSKMPDDHMDAIEPFDYKELKPFSTAYLPGFLADKYDVSVQDCAERADSRCETSAVELMEQDARGDYTSCTVESQNVTLHRGKVHYALMPVWLLSTKWNGKSFLFAMNGQTGKLVGDLPLDKGLYWKHFAAITGLCMLGVMAAGLLLSL